MHSFVLAAEMPLRLARHDPPLFLQLPSEIRVEIFRNLLCVQRTRKQKPISESRLSTSRYSWDLHPAILATCRQIHEEARNLLIRENRFVVFECAAGELDQASKRFSTSPSKLKLWSGRRFGTAPITNEVMRVRLHRYENHKQTESSIYVVLEGEVLDLCAGLATYIGTNGYDCRLAELNLHVVISPSQMKESNEAQASRETTLLRSVMALRRAASIKIEGADPELAREFSSQLRHRRYCDQVGGQVTKGLSSAGDNAFDIGDYTAALGFYYRAFDYYKYCCRRKGLLTDTGDWTVFTFTLGQKRARSWLEMNDFRNTCLDMDANISLLTLDPGPIAFVDGIPLIPKKPDPILPTMSEEEKSIEDQRIWKWERFREAVARFQNRITCEDIGRCYMYRSIALRCRPDGNPSLAAEDRSMSLACCGDWATSGDGYINELLELERRMMIHFVSQ